MQGRASECAIETVGDDELLRLFAVSRSERYFAELFRRHGRKVFASCYAFLGDVGRAEEVSQETFIQAFRCSESFSGGNVRGWLLRIARNRCIDQWRSRPPEVSQETLGRDYAPETSHGTTGSAVHLALLQLERELPELPLRQQTCLRLKAEGYSYQETAERMGCSMDEVRSHLQNGRRTLRLRMGNVLAEIG
jgi:RNA polymerase sigma-70 factor (ECF subfamily)